jgi:hypothetical protein
VIFQCQKLLNQTRFTQIFIKAGSVAGSVAGSGTGSGAFENGVTISSVAGRFRENYVLKEHK